MSDDFQWTGDGATGRPPEMEYRPPDEESATVAVVRAVAALTDRTVLDMEPLYHVIDPDRLDGLFGGRSDADEQFGAVTFEFAGCHVEVTPEVVRVREENQE